MKNKFYFSEQFSSHARVLCIMRVNGGHSYKPRALWMDKWIKLAGNRHHYYIYG